MPVTDGRNFSNLGARILAMIFASVLSCKIGLYDVWEEIYQVSKLQLLRLFSVWVINNHFEMILHTFLSGDQLICL